jgi:predicted acylesterase/phospholipase RssA
VALGGGGPRRFLHVGAVRALREAGLPIDCVSGTSIGSVMGGLVALNWDQETVEGYELAAAAGTVKVDDIVRHCAMSSTLGERCRHCSWRPSCRDGLPTR